MLHVLSWGLAAVMAVAVPSPLFEQARRPLQHVTPPPRIASLSATDCGPCHRAIYDQWRHSRHAQSFTNRIFAASFRREPLRWCVYCHAPLPAQVEALRDARSVRPGRSPLVDEGVNCAVCHVRDGAILSARPPSTAALRAHPVRLTPELAKAEFCGGCHQFNFPRIGVPIRYTHQPMQDTLAEWRHTPQRRTCQNCHMPAGAHRFPGGHDTALLRDTVRASVRRLPDGRLQVELHASNAGHRVPTGDPFRRLELQLYANGTDAELLARYSFARRFRKPPGGDAFSWVLAHDLTIPPPADGRQATRTIDLPAPDAATPARFWRLHLAYAAGSSLPDLRGDDVSVEIARGQVMDALPAEPGPAAHFVGPSSLTP